MRDEDESNRGCRREIQPPVYLIWLVVAASEANHHSWRPAPRQMIFNPSLVSSVEGMCTLSARTENSAVTCERFRRSHKPVMFQ